MKLLRVQEAAPLPRHMNEELVQRRFDQHPQRHQQIVSRRAQDGDMKPRVGLCSLLERCGATHVVERLAYLAHLILCPSLGSQCSRFRLDDMPELLHRSEKVFAVRRRDVPAQHVSIEQIPVLLGLHPTSDLRSGGEQTLGHQHLDGLAHRRTADIEGFRPLRLVRQDRSWRIVAAYDPESDLAGEPDMYVRPSYPGSVRAAADKRPVRHRFGCRLRWLLGYALRHFSSIVLTVAAGFMARLPQRHVGSRRALNRANQVPSTGNWGLLVIPAADTSSNCAGYENRARPWPCGSTRGSRIRRARASTERPDRTGRSILWSASSRTCRRSPR